MNNNNNIINNDINFTDLLQSNMEKKILSYNHYSKSDYLSHCHNYGMSFIKFHSILF